ncbi:Acyl-CoA synthetase (NDP forming) [Sulfobacillus thermosulfidooxidans DSM 9293]|uniref:Acyl-CoA synthetase (NDP forming) n=1 Tax=Sulfobacillus thermosulfidooxidans (strain DSM 9293 / VKM B-1269 / AT-1) TaxID=929705 RepID=A0A1W1W7F5_SULTA|nr:GNAT family N-acetyltransferase [Sulfobacillus thermosulfidooxidans]SMC02216.1 Acyl-CoA synthetase (NDP forming) [Sulfobacillus thermosulfidooxidans DSM 9293]
MARIILRDGRVADLREARPTETDREMLRELFRNASPDALYHRFFHMVKEVDDAEIDRMLSAGGRGKALVCVSQNQILGIGHYIMVSDTTAEVAFFVDERIQGRGLGTLLLEHLAEQAWRRGVLQFEAYVLSENQPMLRVFQDSGYEIHEQQDSGVIHLVLPLQQTERIHALAGAREKLATAASLRAFFEPSVVAIIGASRDSHRLGHLLLQHVLNASFTGVVYPVNPSARAILGVKAYPSVKDIPDPVDLAVIVVPRDLVSQVVMDCIEAHVRAVLITSAGFSDQDEAGAELEQSITQMLRHEGIRLVGPNSLGIINTSNEVRMNASFSPTLPPQGTVAIASQSGALGIAILDYASRMGVGVSSFVSTGNKADVSSNDLLQYWEDDPATEMILLYLESFGNPRKFTRIARRITQHKPILVVKSARSADAVLSPEMASQHFGDDNIVKALFQQTGIIRADTLQELFDVAALLSSMPLPAGKRVQVIANASGAAVITVDALKAGGMHLAHPPIDLGFTALAPRYYDEVHAALKDPHVDAIIVLFIPVGISEAAGVSAAIRDAVMDVGLVKPIVANFLMTGPGPIDYIRGESFRIPVYPFPELAVRALVQVSHYAAYRRQPLGHLPDLDRVHMTQARALARAWQTNAPIWIGSQKTFELLALAGLESSLSSFDRQSAILKLSLSCHIDSLFGPVLTVRTATSQMAHSRLIPLTDRDAMALAHGIVKEDNVKILADVVEKLTDLFLRVSRLIDDVPEIMELTIPHVMVNHYEHAIEDANTCLEPRAM